MKIGWFSDWIGVSSGFGTVSRNILTRLQSRGHHVSQLAVGWTPWKSYSAMDDPRDKARFVELAQGDTPTWELSDALHKMQGGIPVYEVTGHDTRGGHECLGKWIKQEKPDVMVVLGDVWVTAYFTMTALQGEMPCPMVYYQPLDGCVEGRQLPWHTFYQGNTGNFRQIKWESIFCAQENTVFYGPWSRDLVMENLPEAVQAAVVDRFHIIPHGVNTELYQPRPMGYCRKLIGIPETAFVVGMVATNQSRKRWPEMCQAMGRFMALHPNVYFVPWTSFNTNMDGWNFHRLMELYLPQDRVIFDNNMQIGKHIPEERLALLYGALDVHVLWHAGEGCGLPHLEAQACGRPALAVDYAGITDYFSDDRCRIPWNHSVVGQGNCIERVYGDQAALLEKLETLYGDPVLRSQLGAAGMQYAQKHWGWDGIVDEWETHLQNVISGGRREPYVYPQVKEH